jgi:hypothetical protein
MSLQIEPSVLTNGRQNMPTQSHQLAWSPQEGPQSALADCWLPEIFFGGARFGGKTDGVLGKWALKEKLYGPAFNAMMFRRTMVASEDAIERSREIYPKLGAKMANGVWRMPHGGRIGFGYLDSIADADAWQGRNLSDIWIEEVGLYARPDVIWRLFGVLRSAHGVPVQMILTGNPGGPGQHWVRARYELNPFPRKPRRLLRPLPDGSLHQVAVIPSRITDNKIGLQNDPGYVGRLHMVGSAQLVKAWLDGDWTAIEGAFFDCWSERNIVSPFSVPRDWVRFRSGDWGSFSPFSFGWWAVVQDDFSLPARVDQSQLDARGTGHHLGKSKAANNLLLPRGAIIRYREWYGSTDPAQGGAGLKLTADQVADGIIQRERDDPRLAYGVLDPSTFKVDGGPSIAERINAKLAKARMPSFRAADNTRVNTRDSKDKRGPMNGWDQMRARIVGRDGVPMMYCFSTCVASIRTIPVLQHDPAKPEDLDTESEDHCFAAGTMVETDRGRIPIEQLPETGCVLSLGGYRFYRSARRTRSNAEIMRLTFDSGVVIRCTKDHKFLVDFDEWRYAKDLQGSEVLCAQSSSATRSKNSMASAIISAVATFNTKANGCISRFGSSIAEPFRKIITFTTRTTIDRITTSGTLNALLFQSIWADGTAKRAEIAGGNQSQKQISPPPLGMRRRQDANGIQSISNSTSSRPWIGAFLRSAKNAARNIWLALRGSPKESSAGQIAGRVRCVSVEEAGRADVYCLTVPETGCFAIEGGILVSNCADDWRYACSSRPWTLTIKEPEVPPDAYEAPSDRHKMDDVQSSVKLL